MASKTKLVTAGALGFVIGLIAMERITAASMPTLLRIVRTNLLVEERFSAISASSSGNHAKALVHRWNAAELSRADGKDLLSRHFREVSGLTPMGLRLLAVGWLLDLRFDKDKQECGARIEEGTLRRNLAANLRELRFDDWAIIEAQEAERLLGRNDAAFITYQELLEFESSPLRTHTQPLVPESEAASARRPTPMRPPPVKR
jgi:hypothetical protein